MNSNNQGNHSQNNGSNNVASQNQSDVKHIPGKGHQENFHIFINNIKYYNEDGVKPSMSGRELAALVPVPADNADITRKNSTTNIGVDEVIELNMADHFEIIRKQVNAGSSC